MRALAIAEQTQLSMEIFSQAHSVMSKEAQASYLMLIDHNIAAGARHRNIWHLSSDTQEPLDKVLAQALSIRGNDVEKRYAAMETKGGINPTEKQNLKKTQEALRIAKQELVDSKKAAAIEK
jgi:hypothetical protein